MADLGTLTTLQASEILSISKRHIFVPMYSNPMKGVTEGICKSISAQMWSALQGPGSRGEKLFLPFSEGTISGTVTTSGVADSGYLVHLFYRTNGYLIASTRTSPTGTFSFSAHLNKNEIQNYTVIAFDLTNTHNAIVYDLLTPG